MSPNPDPDLNAIRASVERVGRLSDSILRVGPFSIGLDGVMAWVPVLGEIYSAAAGGFILIQGARAGVSGPVLLAAAAIMAFRTSVSAVPLVGPAFADVFTAHKWSARMIVAAIDRKLGKTIQRPSRGLGEHAVATGV
jgi:hypothetical protein